MALAIDGISGNGGKREKYYICQELKAFQALYLCQPSFPSTRFHACISKIFKALLKKVEARGKEKESVGIKS